MDAREAGSACGVWQGTAGFLAFSDEGPDGASDQKLAVGQMIDCLVTSASDKRLVHVTADPSKVAAAVSPDWGDASIGELQFRALIIGRDLGVASTGGLGGLLEGSKSAGYADSIIISGAAGVWGPV